MSIHIRQYNIKCIIIALSIINTVIPHFHALTFAYKNIHARIGVHEFTHTHTHIRTRARAYTHTHTHSYTLTHTHSHTNSHTHSFLNLHY